MKCEKEKALKIMNELVNFYLMLHIFEVKMEMEYMPTHTTIRLEGHYPDPDYKKLERFLEKVNIARQDELDEYYWNLVGSSQYPEFTLLGTLVDVAEMTYDDDILRIKLIREIKS